jgi:Arc/MetJ-type ribon-helix-helix transcriptional regulator
MEIRLRPEVEALIRQDLEYGPYQTVEEFVEHAVVLLHEQEAWLAGHRNEIEAKIAEGYAAARRGELIDAQEVRSRLKKRKNTMSAEKPPE